MGPTRAENCASTRSASSNAPAFASACASSSVGAARSGASDVAGSAAVTGWSPCVERGRVHGGGGAANG